MEERTLNETLERYFNKPMETPQSPFHHLRMRCPVLRPTQASEVSWEIQCMQNPTCQASVNGNPNILLNKLVFMQAYHWTAMVDTIEMRTNRNEEGNAQGVRWTREDMLGMINWYRFQLHLSTFVDWRNVPAPQGQAAACPDGMWLTVLLTSPWHAHPDFDEIKGFNTEILRDTEGFPLLSPIGLPVYATTEHCSAEKESEFIQIWQRVANRDHLPRHENGDYYLPVSGYRPIYMPNRWPVDV